MKKFLMILLMINLALIVIFTAIFWSRHNYEFIIYVCVIIFAMFLIALSINKVEYTAAALVGLTIWSAMHLAGGGLTVAGQRLYDIILIPISQTYPIIRYDQIVHIWGFGSVTIVMFCLLKKALKRPLGKRVAISIVLVMAGMGVGAFNESLEFIVSAIVPQSGVGGYLNTSLDLCSNLIGAILAMIYIRVFYLGPNIAQ